MKKIFKKRKTVDPTFSTLLLLFFGMEFKNLLIQCFVASPLGRTLNFWGIVPFLKGLIYSLSVLLLFCFPVLLIQKRRNQRNYLWSINILFTLLALTDVCYFRNFHVMPSLEILKTAGAGIGKGQLGFTLIFSSFSYLDILFAADFLLILGRWIDLKVQERKKERNKSLKEQLVESSDEKREIPLQKRLLSVLALFLALLFLLSVVPFIHIFGALDRFYKDVYQPAYNVNTVGYFTPLGYHFLDCMELCFSSLSDNIQESTKDSLHHQKKDKEELSEIQAFYRYNDENLPENKYFGMFKGYNLMLIQVESMENFVIGEKIDGVEITPNLNALLKSSIYFSNIYDQVKSGNSCDCDLMINSSLLPTTKMFFKHYGSVNLPSMPEILREEGYETYYHNGSGNHSVWPYEKIYSNVFGYNVKGEHPNFFMVNEPNKEERVYHYASDEYTFKTVLQHLKKVHAKEHPFFTHTVLCSSHTPFYYENLEGVGQLPEEHLIFGQEGEKLKKNKAIAYLNDLHYVDAQIGMFLSELKKEGLLEKTVVAIYGDHSGIHKYFPSQAEKLSKSHPKYLFVEKSVYPSIPVILYDPTGKIQNETVDLYGGQVDLMPTFLSLLGIEKEKFSFSMGKNLLSTNRNYVVLANGTVLGNLKENDPDYRTVYRMYHTADLIAERGAAQVVKNEKQLPPPIEFFENERKKEDDRRKNGDC